MRQASLMHLLAAEPRFTEGLAGVMPEIRARMNAVAKRYEPGRDILAEVVTETAQNEGIGITPKGGKAITAEQLKKILQPKDGEHEPLLTLILCFCLATKDFSPLEAIWKPFGLVLIPAEKLRFLALGEAQAKYEEARAELKDARARL